MWRWWLPSWRPSPKISSPCCVRSPPPKNPNTTTRTVCSRMRLLGCTSVCYSRRKIWSRWGAHFSGLREKMRNWSYRTGFYLRRSLGITASKRKELFSDLLDISYWLVLVFYLLLPSKIIIYGKNISFCGRLDVLGARVWVVVVDILVLQVSFEILCHICHNSWASFG